MSKQLTAEEKQNIEKGLTPVFGLNPNECWYGESVERMILAELEAYKQQGTNSVVGSDWKETFDAEMRRLKACKQDDVNRELKSSPVYWQGKIEQMEWIEQNLLSSQSPTQQPTADWEERFRNKWKELGIYGPHAVTYREELIKCLQSSQAPTQSKKEEIK